MQSVQLDEIEAGAFGKGSGFFGGLGYFGCFVRGALKDLFKVHTLAVELRSQEVRVFLADVVEFFTGNIVVEVVVASREGRVGVRRRQLDEFAIIFGLHDAVDVAVGGVIPDTLGGEVHGEAVG